MTRIEQTSILIEKGSNANNNGKRNYILKDECTQANRINIGYRVGKVTVRKRRDNIFLYSILFQTVLVFSKIMIG